MAAQLYIANDQTMYLIGLRTSGDFVFKANATVTATIVDELGGVAVTGGGPESLIYVNVGTNTFGGTTADPTVVKATSGLDLEVTVGATTALELDAGRLIHAMHDDRIWQVRRAAAGVAGADVSIHLEPFIWSGTEPTKVKMTTGEIMEIVDGTYKGTIDQAFTVDAGTTYYVKFVVAVPGGLDATWYEELEAAYRMG